MNRICFNGKQVDADEPVLTSTNRGYRYGDALFETMKVLKGRILFEELHFERLFNGLQLLKFNVPKLVTPLKLRDDIIQLCKKNGTDDLARVRLSVSRGEGGLYETEGQLQYIIESSPANESVNRLNENGLAIDVYQGAKKSCDQFANIKSANFLPYAMAAHYAKHNQLNDALVLNVHNRIADATIANVWMVKGNEVLTPQLSEGCIKGVLRSYILQNKEKLLDRGFQIRETELTTDDLLSAEEVFLTNAINGIRWVGQFRHKIYGNEEVKKIYSFLFQTIYG